LGKLPFPKLDLNATMTLEELQRIGQQCRAEEYSIEKNIFFREYATRETYCTLYENR